ncbi:FixJ family two-component response regulator [Bradyrhizobium sp. LB7.2]
MLGLVHVVDGDSAFQTAVEHRQKLAGYDVAASASAEQLLDRLRPTPAAFSSMCDYRE